MASSTVPARRRRGITAAATRVDAYAEPKTRAPEPEQPAPAPEPEPAPAPQADPDLTYIWPDHLNSTVLPELPRVGVIPAAPPAAATPSPDPAEAAAVTHPDAFGDLLAGTVLFLGPRPHQSDVAARLSASGALVVEVDCDPTTVEGAAMIGTGAAIARKLT